MRATRRGQAPPGHVLLRQTGNRLPPPRSEPAEVLFANASGHLGDAGLAVYFLLRNTDGFMPTLSRINFGIPSNVAPLPNRIVTCLSRSWMPYPFRITDDPIHVLDDVFLQVINGRERSLSRHITVAVRTSAGCSYFDQPIVLSGRRPEPTGMTDRRATLLGFDGGGSFFGRVSGDVLFLLPLGGKLVLPFEF